MGESHSGNSGSVVSTSTTTSKVDSSHTNHNEFGNQQVSIGGSTGAGTSIAFSNLALIRLPKVNLPKVNVPTPVPGLSLAVQPKIGILLI